MAEDTVDALRPYITDLPRVRTKNLRLRGTGEWRPSSELETHLYQRFGSDSAELLELISGDPSMGQCPIEGQRYVNAEFVYAVRHEMATSLVDLLTRRTRAHLHDARATLAGAPAIARLVASELGWSDEEREGQVGRYRELVEHELSCAGLTP